MKVNKAAIDLIKNFEGCRLNAYICPGNVVTIGWGTTYYKDGSKIKMGDKITRKEADEIFEFQIQQYAAKVLPHIKAKITENQFGALVSFGYNVGVNGFAKSTLLKKININHLDPSIKIEFLRWNKAAGKILAGLTKRREAEAKLYFT